MNKNSIKPTDIFLEIDELIFQNTKNTEKQRKKFTLELLGSPGIGKTQCVENYPFYHLAKVNKEIIFNILKKDIDIKYKKTNKTIEEQTKEILEKNNISNKDIEKCLKQIKKSPLIAVKIVRQSDIIVPEDISGLPSSDSDLKQIETILNICEKLNLKELEKVILTQFEITINNILKRGSSDSEFRNTSKFDFTEWEKDVHTLAETYEHVILLLDDITRSAANNPSILNVIMPIFQEYYVGQRKLPDNCSVIVTSNEKENDSGEINYVVDFDQAQKDRLRTKKICFDYQDWKQWAEENDVHETIIYFLEDKLDYIKEEIITPRRLSELGQCLSNKFGKELNLEKDKEEIFKTLNFHLNDSKNKKYLNILTEYIGFLKILDSEIKTFLKEFFEKGYNEELKTKIKSINKKGETIKLNIITNQIYQTLINTPLKETQINHIIKFFNDENLPISNKFNILNLLHKWSEDIKKYENNQLSNEGILILKQINMVLSVLSKKIGQIRDKENEIAQTYLKNFIK